uniref:Ig-like domain-containing protein n=1 Tax=Panagrolaimus superbus TaxID=310955 RepID=A0A914ZCP1_9BILA
MGASFRTMDSISNQTVPIYCRTSGIPFPSIEWFFGDKKIEQSANYEIGENGTLLRVKNVQSKDVGRYSCVAKNKVGRAESDVFLEVIEAPQIVDTPQEIKIIEGQDKTIKCNVKGKPIPEISWRKDGEPIEHIGARGNENYIHISRAQLKDAGHYTCIATNRVGEKRQSIHVKVLVPPKIGDGERILKSVEGNNLTLNCPIVSGTGIPAPEIRWSKNGKLLEAMGSQLHLQNLTVSDATKFSCEAKNEAGTASADYVVDVFVKPRIRIQQSDIRVIEGERARMECKVDGNPPPTIQWLRGGRPITDMNNFLLSPRGESLMILKASTNDGGGYSCLAKNIAGDSEGVFSVTVLTAPYLEQTVDQNPKVIAKAGVTLNCPVRGNPTPVVTWKFNGIPISIDGKKYSQPAGTNDLAISEVSSKNSGRYTCNAVNEVRALDTDYALDVIAPPQFQGTGKKIYEILSGETVTMTCPLEASTLLEISWFRGGNPVYLSENIQISPDGQRITVVKAALEDNGKYTCEAENQAGKTEAEVFLKVYVAPTIDDSNLIENPLAVLGKAIYLECPVDGIPQPIITWLKNGKPLDPGGRYSFQQNNITFGISNVESDDVGKYSCVAENKGGRAEENFNLQVLAPPELTTNETQKITRREGDEVTLLCPVRQIYSPDPNEERDIAWTKDGRSLGGTSLSVSPENGNSNGEKTFHISKDGYRLIISNLKLDHAGDYRCLVTNRAGEVQGKFEVETLCNHLGTLLCRELEQRHISEYQKESERRKQLAKEEERRRSAMRQWHFDASQRGIITHSSSRQQQQQQQQQYRYNFVGHEL